MSASKREKTLDELSDTEASGEWANEFDDTGDALDFKKREMTIPPNDQPFFVDNIETDAGKKNNNFRAIVFTHPKMQLLYQSLIQGQRVDVTSSSGAIQFFGVEKGRVKVEINGDSKNARQVKENGVFIIPPDIKCEIVNDKSGDSRFYSVTTPSLFEPGLVQKVKR